MNLTGRLVFNLDIKGSKTTSVAGQVLADNVVFSNTIQYSVSGTGANQLDRMHTRNGTLGTGTGDNIVLTTLIDAFGDAGGFARVRAIYFKNTGEAALSIGAFGSLQAVVRPGGSLMLATGELTAYPTAGNNEISISNDDTPSGSYELVLLGASA